MVQVAGHEWSDSPFDPCYPVMARRSASAKGRSQIFWRAAMQAANKSGVIQSGVIQR
ncbi:hypothetical protein CSIRO_4033 [Bradyrhizobiaceae bacterium SG-6C]|nr:hypothetical protein CSIRO_4033 [Bradyrhizobiaceae bacterium SG-6C]